MTILKTPLIIGSPSLLRINCSLCYNEEETSKIQKGTSLLIQTLKNYIGFLKMKEIIEK